METQTDKATCLRSHSTKGTDTGLYIKCLLTTPQPVPEALSRRTAEGLVGREEGSMLASCQLVFHCLEMQGFLRSKTLQPS